MKKLIAFILSCLPLFGLSFLKGNPISTIFNLDGVEKACFVTEDDYDKDVINTLSYNYVYAEKEDIQKVNSEIDSEAIVLFFENQDIEKLKKSLNMLVFKEEEINGMQIIYGYTALYDKSLILENKRVNVQIVVDGERMIAGFPMILTGF